MSILQSPNQESELFFDQLLGWHDVVTWMPNRFGGVREQGHSGTHTLMGVSSLRSRCPKFRVTSTSRQTVYVNPR